MSPVRFKPYGPRNVILYQSTCGCFKVLKAEDMEAIYKMARG